MTEENNNLDLVIQGQKKVFENMFGKFGEQYQLKRIYSSDYTEEELKQPIGELMDYEMCGMCDGKGYAPYQNGADDFDMDTCHICEGEGWLPKSKRVEKSNYDLKWHLGV